MSEVRPQVLIERLADLMARQRASLESSDYDSLPTLLAECEQALTDIQAYPGGVEALVRDLDAQPVGQRDALRASLEQANVDHRIGRDLINLAMQRSAALQGFVATQSDGATYSEEGAVSHAAGTLLSRKA